MQVDPPSVGTSSSAISSLAPSSSAFGTLSAFVKMDFAIRDSPGGRDRDVHSHQGQMRSPRVKGPICRARTRELDPVSDIHLIHHLGMEELEEGGVGDVEGGIFAMLRRRSSPTRTCAFSIGVALRQGAAVPALWRGMWA